MSTTKVQRPVEMENPEAKMVQNERHRRELQRRQNSYNPTNNNFPKKHKHENDCHKFGSRKRAHSFTTGSNKFVPPKRRKNERMIPPTKFLLGGNIYDPLNLNSLQDEAVNRKMNAVTPKSSPLPTPKHRKGAIEVIIPPNLHDPLNLLTSCDDDAEYEQNLVSPVKKGRKPRNKKRKRSSLSGCSSKENSIEGQTVEMEVDKSAEEAPLLDTSTESLPTESVAQTVPKTECGPSRNLDLPLKKDAPKDKQPRSRKMDVKDKIVSPVIPQPRVWMRPHGYRPNAKYHQKPLSGAQMPKFKAKNAKYQYGNYNRYYGYRNQNQDEDVRLKILSERRSLFHDKDILDIGCNIGHITLSVARDLGARSVVGLDIDKQLIGIARKNIRHYVKFKDSPLGVDNPDLSKPKFFPISMPIVYGPVDVPGVSESPCSRKKFPDNVTFVQGSYVLDSEALLSTEQSQFDVILCLSVTKWIHLNWGDAGMKQAFCRMFTQLRPGGKLILEAQGWDSYKKRKTLTETIYKNYHEIRFFPQKFTQYLLSEVGFSKCEVLATPFHPSKGFQRPMQMFTKGSFSSTYSAPSDSNTPSYLPVTGRTKAPVYTPVVVSTRSVDEDESFEPLDVMDEESSQSSQKMTESADTMEDEMDATESSEKASYDADEKNEIEGRTVVEDFQVEGEIKTLEIEDSFSCSSENLVRGVDVTKSETQDSC